ncbi:MAG: hypothetical protein RL026_1433 [Pseudomonadota bacterium]
MSRLLQAACAAAVLLAATPLPVAAMAAAPPTAAPSWTRSAAYVPMADGTQLAVTVYLPAAAQPGQRFPLLLWYLPGHRESIDPATGRLIPAWDDEDLRYFTAHGYALAAAEMRGSGASTGYRELDRGPQIGRDGRELVDWLAAQPWSDGRVGMVGASYQGFAQYATAAHRPPALKALFPEIAGFDDYTSMFHPGGIQNLALTRFATASIVRDDLNYHEPAAPRPRYPSAPVVDEDGDGELADEIPVDANGNGSFLDDGPPAYRDGQPRRHLYFLATRGHERNANLTVEALAAAPFRDSPLGGTPYDYAVVDPADRAQRLAGSGIAVYHRGGWFDYHARDTVMWQATLQGHTPSYLMMAPTGHGGFPGAEGDALYRAGPYFRHFGDSTSTRHSLNEEKRAFFDHHLRGLDNGFDRRLPVRLYVMGHGWRDEAAWPLARQRLVRHALREDGRLDTQPGPPAPLRWTVDLTADSTSQGANRWNYGVSGAREPLSLDATATRRKAWTGDALPADLEVTGHPVLTVHLSSTAPEGDLYAYLEDVAPDGRSLLVTEGQLRLNYPTLLPAQQITGVPARVIEVKPALPWHGYRRSDYVPAPLAGGRVRAYTLDLLPTAWVFKAGHRLRLSIAGADAPSFALHPAQAGPGVPAPVWTFHLGPELSNLVLPVIPAHPQRAGPQGP